MADEKDPLGVSWKVAGGFLLTIVIAAVVFLVIWPGSTPESEGQDGGTSAGPEQSQAQSGSPSQAPKESEDTQDAEASAQCDFGDASSDFPATAPDFEWEEHPNGVTLPVSEEHGPVVRDGDFWRCTSQTPTGVAFAGMSLYASFLEGNYDAAEDSPRAQAIQEQMQEGGVEQADMVMRGYRIVNSSESDATVEYWTEDTAGEFVMSARLELAWDEDAQDWRLDLSDGDMTVTPIEDTSQFTEWR